MSVWTYLGALYKGTVPARADQAKQIWALQVAETPLEAGFGQGRSLYRLRKNSGFDFALKGRGFKLTEKLGF